MVYTGDLDAREVDARRQNQTSDNSWVHAVGFVILAAIVVWAASRIPREEVALGQSGQTDSPQSRLLRVPGVPRWESSEALGAASALRN